MDKKSLCKSTQSDPTCLDPAKTGISLDQLANASEPPIFLPIWVISQNLLAKRFSIREFSEHFKEFLEKSGIRYLWNFIAS